ncbi:helix-turn-helix domain-containing protein [Desulfoferrobacter suflitae]|uniref:helix-turn-helix domain-containing protein n=1 Tax=Desulfoferrobacter suflitae TaxID=2865782 RepID=UPI002164C961|nr:XRE family transcriptional regulator [Desulfoferrobacter suflitae]MCK8601536.1 XRE family transcriptional regulator [Desulfoferrobacter suflitae]
MADQQSIDPNVEALRIGDKMKEMREKHRYTFQDLAAKTDLSKEYLTQVENNEVDPPVATLLKLAKALNVSMSYFFQDQAGSEKIAVTRASERTRVERRPHHQPGEVNYIYEALEAKKAEKQMQPFLVEFPPQDTSDMVFVSHEGEEFLHLLDGRLEFRSTDRVEVLDPGDSIYFESDVSHSFRCLSEQPARAIVVVWSRP